MRFKKITTPESAEQFCQCLGKPVAVGQPGAKNIKVKFCYSTGMEKLYVVPLISKRRRRTFSDDIFRLRISSEVMKFSPKFG